MDDPTTEYRWLHGLYGELAHTEFHMDRPAFIYFVRHGQSFGNVTSRDERATHDLLTTDYPLTQLGREQARVAGKWMQTHVPRPDAILVSDFLRAQQTADLLGYDDTIYREEHAMLGEQDFGLWYMNTEAQMQGRYPDEVRRRDLMLKDELFRSYHWRPLAGDSARDVETRVWATWHDLCQRFAGQTVVLVGHGTWATVFMKVVLRWTARFYEEHFREMHPANGAVLCFRSPSTPTPQLMLREHVYTTFTPEERDDF